MMEGVPAEVLRKCTRAMHQIHAQDPVWTVREPDIDLDFLTATPSAAIGWPHTVELFSNGTLIVEITMRGEYLKWMSFITTIFCDRVHFHESTYDIRALTQDGTSLAEIVGRLLDCYVKYPFRPIVREKIVQIMTKYDVLVFRPTYAPQYERALFGDFDGDAS